jgi:hypothetical protein
VSALIGKTLVGGNSWVRTYALWSVLLYVKSEGLSMGQSTFTPLFKTIPPERVGLFGEYDHKGLSKRVSLAFNQNFEPSEIRGLRINQRGAVVVLMGQISSQRLLIKLISVAMDVSGAVDVEINGISVAHRLKAYLEVKPSKDVLLNLLALVNSQ